MRCRRAPNVCLGKGHQLSRWNACMRGPCTETVSRRARRTCWGGQQTCPGRSFWAYAAGGSTIAQQESDWGENQGTPKDVKTMRVRCARPPCLPPRPRACTRWRRARSRGRRRRACRRRARRARLARARAGARAGASAGFRVRRRGARRAHAARARAACSRRPRRSPWATRCRRWSACRA